MKLSYLKKQLKLKPAGVGDVFFTTTPEFNAVKNQAYPYVLWDLATFKSRLQWTNLSQSKEVVPLTGYIMGIYDKRSNSNTITIEEKWDELRELFQSYLTYLNSLPHINITNLEDMPNELYDFGVLIPETEIGVSFTVNFELFCNVSE